MFDNLSTHLTERARSWRNALRFNDKIVAENLRELKKTLLAADVSLKVVDHFIATIREKAAARIADHPVAPGQAFLSLVYETLLELLGGSSSALQLRTQPPAVIMMVGLSGSGKTTSAVKLACWLKKEHKKIVAVGNCDALRPAAQKQIATLAQQAGVLCYPRTSDDEPAKTAAEAQAKAIQGLMDVLVIDTSGCVNVHDDELIKHLQAVHATVNPIEVLLVIDCMTGQSAIEAIEFFADNLAISGLVLSKTDGDARGGVALSARYLTRKAIKFIGSGERIDDFDEFSPATLAKRILGLSDIDHVAKKINRHADARSRTRLKDQLSGKKRFTLNDMRREIEKMKSLRGMKDLLSAVPGVPRGMLKNEHMQQAEKIFNRAAVIIDSMTPEERRNPEIIKASRKRRIAQGAGSDPHEVNQVLNQFEQMQKMIKRTAGKKRKH